MEGKRSEWEEPVIPSISTEIFTFGQAVPYNVEGMVDQVGMAVVPNNKDNVRSRRMRTNNIN